MMMVLGEKKIVKRKDGVEKIREGLMGKAETSCSFSNDKLKTSCRAFFLYRMSLLLIKVQSAIHFLILLELLSKAKNEKLPLITKHN